MQRTASGEIRSPLTSTGTAGGQLTQGSARIRPALFPSGTSSAGASMASRTGITRSGREDPLRDGYRHSETSGSEGCRERLSFPEE